MIKNFFNSIRLKYLKPKAVIEEKDNDSLDKWLITDFKFVNLAPKDNLENIESYLYALDTALSDEKVFNIALTGSYGSGKSSIISTFIKRYQKKYSYINISLAEFELKNEDKSNDKELEQLIEKSVLQQLFYKVLARHIPYSRFKKIYNLKSGKVLFWIIVCATLISVGSFLFIPDFIDSVKVWYKIVKLNSFNSNFISGIVISLFITLVTFLLNKIITYTIRKINIISIKFLSTSIEVGDKSKESIFNRYLDEILYFFEVTKYNVVVIEDLDRFENQKIFTKLRELNRLINQYDLISRKKKVVFVYALKDDMFISKNRTKFFDFIIPVIPVINSSNSRDKLIERVKNSKVENLLSEAFINDITLYIDDMRILNNVMNEFAIYLVNLNQSGIDAEKLFALIVFKNLYPDEFEKLQYNAGEVGAIFSNKRLIIEKYCENMRQEIIQLETEISGIKTELLVSIKELKASAIYMMFSTDYPIITFTINHSGRYDMRGFIEGNDISFLSFEKIENLHVQSLNSTRNYNKAEVEKIRVLAKEFIIRETHIESRNSRKENQLSIKIDELKKRIYYSQSLTLKQLIKSVGENEVLGSVINKPLIIYLVRNGYIDEMYHNYVTYFYPENMNYEENKFVLSVKDYKRLNMDHKLQNFDRIMENLYPADFLREETLNLSLIEHIFDNHNSEKYKLYIESIIEQLSNEKKCSTEFVDQFRLFTKHKEVFLNMLCRKWSNIWNFIIEESNYSEDHIKEYLIEILKYVEISDLVLICSKSDLKKAISEFSDIDKNLSIDFEERLINIFRLLKIKLVSINTDFSMSKLYEEIYLTNSYLISYKNICAILERNKKVNQLEIIESSYYTAVIESELDELIQYVDENKSIFFNETYFIDGKMYDEKSKTMEKLLNDEDILIETRQTIIDMNCTILPDITKINNRQFWTRLMVKEKIKIDWNNLYCCYVEFGSLSMMLIDNINNRIEALIDDKESLVGLFEEETFREFYKNVMCSNELNDSTSEELVKFISIQLNEIDFSIIEDKRAELLIDSNAVSFNQSNYYQVKEHQPGLINIFVEKNHTDFLANFNAYFTDEEDYSIYFTCKLISNEEKLGLILSIAEDVKVKDIIFHETISKIILDTKISIEQKQQLTVNLMFNNLFDHNISQELKVKLLLVVINEIEQIKLTDILSRIGGEYKGLTEKRKQSVFEKNQVNFDLLNKLTNILYISSFKPTHSDKEYRAFTFHS